MYKEFEGGSETLRLCCVGQFVRNASHFPGISVSSLADGVMVIKIPHEDIQHEKVCDVVHILENSTALFLFHRV